MGEVEVGGLWTPAGTVLLRRAERKEDVEGSESEDGEGKRTTARNNRARANDWVLRTSVPDDSDGILCLTIRWSKDQTSARSVAELRGAASLPPGWGRLRQPALLSEHEKDEEKKEDTDEPQNLPARIEALKSSHAHSRQSTSLRFHTEDNRVQRLLWETHNVETGHTCTPFRYYEQSTAGLWFTCTASALLSRQTSTSGGLWAFEIPSDIKTFVRKDSIPCGVLVLLHILPEVDAPQWSSERENRNEGVDKARKMHQSLTARLAAERLEASMPPEQAKVAKANRRQKELQGFHDEMVSNNAAKQERQERAIKDAIASPRLEVQKVAECALRWLIDNGEIGREWTVEQLAEAVLYLLVVDLQHHQQHPRQDNPEGPKIEESESTLIITILEEWLSWSAAGGMKKQQFHLLESKEAKRAFCFAVALVAVVAEGCTSGSGGTGGDAAGGKVGADMWECLRLWRKVRLG